MGKGRLVLEDGGEVRLGGQRVGDHGAQGDDRHALAVPRMEKRRPRNVGAPCPALCLVEALVKTVQGVLIFCGQFAVQEPVAPRRGDVAVEDDVGIRVRQQLELWQAATAARAARTSMRPRPSIGTRTSPCSPMPSSPAAFVKE